MKMSLVLMALIANSGLVYSAENHSRSRYSLERMLEERDQLIASLLKRVDALEKRGSARVRSCFPMGHLLNPIQGP